jgi:sodium-dependent phosphate transporter
MKQAILVASVCEFGGAVLLGSGVTDTIKSGIAKVSAYTYEPELLMYGMVCALLACGIWLALATFLELPVSTTHSIVGAIVGMSLVAAGADSIVWYSAPKPGSPFPGGVVSIVLAWFITPLMAAVVAALLFIFTKVVVLKAKDPFRRSLFLYPFYTFITVWVVTYFVIQKGVNGWMKSKTYSKTSPILAPENPSCPPAGSGGAYKNKTSGADITISLSGCTIADGENAWISAVTAAVVTVICIAALKWIVKLVEHDLANAEADDVKVEARRAAAAAGGVESGGVVGANVVDGKDAAVGAVGEMVDDGAAPNRTPAMLQSMRKSKIWTTIAAGSNYDIHQSIEGDEKLMAMHNEAELFDRKTELSFKYLQVLTACTNSFAHGANDVANAIGSMASVYAIWQCACANSKANVPIWMFVIGGVGLVIGLATYGYKIMRALGVKMTKLTNSRGYCAELTAAIIVIVSSRYGFPVSTTQVITGAITGIGLEEVISAKLRGEKNAANRFNFKLLFKFFAGWVATLIIAGLTAAAFTAQGIYAPSRQQTDYRAALNTAFNTTNVGMAATLMAPANATDAPTPAQQVAFLEGQKILNATKLSWTANNSTMLNTDYYMQIFQGGTYALGNASTAGVLTGAYMPLVPTNNPISFS